MDEPVPLQNGDVIAVGGVDCTSSPPGSGGGGAGGAAGQGRPGCVTPPRCGCSPGFQGLTLMQLLPSFTAENYLPILVGFGGLCAAMWLLYVVYRLWKRTAYELETLSVPADHHRLCHCRRVCALHII